MRKLAALQHRFVEACRRLEALPRRARRRLVKASALSLPAAALLLAMTGAPARAATITVGGACDLEEAIENANGGAVNGDCVAGDPGADTIVLPASTFLLDTSYGAALPSVTDDLTIEGNGATLDAEGAFRVLSASRPVTIVNTTVTGGSVSGVGSGVGGGIRVTNASLLTILDSRIVGNTCTSSGGGIYAQNATIAGSTISGNSANSTFSMGGGLHVLDNVTITSSTISGNSAGTTFGLGGGFYVRHSATIASSTIRDNSAYLGGGSVVQGSIAIMGSTIRDNLALRGGGVFAGTVSIVDSTFSGNSASQEGGGLWVYNSLGLANSTVSGNEADSAGGGVYLSYGTDRRADLDNATITENSAATGAGLYAGADATVSIRNSIVADQAAGADCGGTGTIADGGLPNLDADGSCGFSLTGGAGLEALADNGGPTQTHGLQAGSSALEAGDDASCEAADQRGIARPQDGDGIAPARCDLGAYERLARGRIVIEAASSPPGDPSSFIFSNDIDGTDFVLSDGESKTFDDTPVGKYKVSQVDPSPDHLLLGIDCTDDNGATALLTATINLDPAEVVTCTFTNAAKMEVPTAAALSLFAADTDPTGRVQLTWETGSESGVLGFHLYRSDSLDGPARRINHRLIPAQGAAAQGGRYRRVDAPGVGDFRYRIELVDDDGATSPGAEIRVEVKALRLFLPHLSSGRR